MTHTDTTPTSSNHPTDTPATAQPRTWLITGATSGLGRALAEAALQAGERVVGTARRTNRFDQLRARYGDSLLAVEHDVRDVDGAAGVIDQAVAAFGQLDVLVNNAGVGQIGTAEEVTHAELHDMLAQHLYGPAAYVRAVLSHFRANGAGSIVQMSSQGGRRSFPAVGSYSAGKFALEGWSEALSGEVADFGIRVLIVEPSRFRTEFNATGVLRAAAPSRDYDAVVAGIRHDMTSSDGQQEGDPVRAAAIIRQVLELDDAPLRLPLGAEAVSSLTAAAERTLGDLQRWAPLSRSADYPDAGPSARMEATA